MFSSQLAYEKAGIGYRYSLWLITGLWGFVIINTFFLLPRKKLPDDYVRSKLQVSQLGTKEKEGMVKFCRKSFLKIYDNHNYNAFP